MTAISAELDQSRLMQLQKESEQAADHDDGTPQQHGGLVALAGPCVSRSADRRTTTGDPGGAICQDHQQQTAPQGKVESVVAWHPGGHPRDGIGAAGHALTIAHKCGSYQGFPVSQYCQQRDYAATASSLVIRRSRQANP